MPTINPDLPDDGDAAVVAAYNVVIQAILSLINGALDSDNLADDSVVASKIHSLAVTAAKLATDAVETDKIKALAVTGAKIAAATLTPDKTSFVGCRAYLSTNQLNLVNDTYTLVALDTESYDIGSHFNTTTSKFTAPANGYYEVSISVEFVDGSVVASKRFVARTIINDEASAATDAVGHSSNTNTLKLDNTDILYLTAGDTIKLEAKAAIGANTCDILSGAASTHMTIRHIA